jgi:hypothetical protein
MRSKSLLIVRTGRDETKRQRHRLIERENLEALLFGLDFVEIDRRVSFDDPTRGGGVVLFDAAHGFPEHLFHHRTGGQDALLQDGHFPVEVLRHVASPKRAPHRTDSGGANQRGAHLRSAKGAPGRHAASIRRSVGTEGGSAIRQRWMKR